MVSEVPADWCIYGSYNCYNTLSYLAEALNVCTVLEKFGQSIECVQIRSTRTNLYRFRNIFQSTYEYSSTVLLLVLRVDYYYIHVYPIIVVVLIISTGIQYELYFIQKLVRTAHTHNFISKYVFFEHHIQANPYSRVPFQFPNIFDSGDEK